MLRDSPSGYGLATIIFHWLSALLIISLFALGLFMTSLDYYSPWYHKAPELHISLGIGLLLLTLLRIIWRACNKTPAPLPSIGKSTLLAANLIKVVLYLFIFTIVGSGYLITTAEGQAASFFNLFGIPATLELSADNVDRIGELHKYCAWGVIIVASLHGLAALFHHFVKHDRTLVRMLSPVKRIN
ncbi:MAG TPA: cytochrome b [Cellvibrio sp.]|nr:cytochrome b [Cellvibrio sp.]